MSTDRRDELEHLKAGLWDRFEQALGLNLSSAAGLSRQIREVMAELEQLAEAEETSVWSGRAADEVAAKRAAKRGGPGSGEWSGKRGGGAGGAGREVGRGGKRGGAGTGAGREVGRGNEGGRAGNEARPD